METFCDGPWGKLRWKGGRGGVKAPFPTGDDPIQTEEEQLEGLDLFVLLHSAVHKVMIPK